MVSAPSGRGRLLHALDQQGGVGAVAPAMRDLGFERQPGIDRGRDLDPQVFGIGRVGHQGVRRASGQFGGLVAEHAFECRIDAHDARGRDQRDAGRRMVEHRADQFLGTFERVGVAQLGGHVDHMRDRADDRALRVAHRAAMHAHIGRLGARPAIGQDVFGRGPGAENVGTGALDRAADVLTHQFARRMADRFLRGDAGEFDGRGVPQPIPLVAVEGHDGHRRAFQRRAQDLPGIVVHEAIRCSKAWGLTTAAWSPRE